MLSKNNYNPDVLSCLANLSNDEVFTPPAVANQMLDLLPSEIWKDKNATFLDPACKSGVFLREIAKRLNVGLTKVIPDHQKRLNHIFKNQLFGIAITELTALLSRRSVYCSKTANGEYSVCEFFETSQGNILFEQTEHSWKQGRCLCCGASQKEYDRDSQLETHAYQFLHVVNPEEIFNMKFDVIIGNPPYQLSDGGFGTSAAPIYHKFVEQAKKLQPRYLSMIIPARWFSGGKGLDEFRDGMLKDNRIREIHDFPDATDVFPGVQIKGGVCYFIWKRDERGLCKVVNYSKNGTVSALERPLKEENADTFIRYNRAVTILKKVKSKNENSLKTLISSRKPFGLATTYRGNEKSFRNAVLLYQNGGVAYVAPSELLNNQHLVDKYKAFVPPLGSGSDSFPHPIIGKPFLGEPNTACTETYLVAGCFENRKEALNLVKYLTTRFLRFLVLLNKPTQHATSKVYQFVPIQNFKETWTDEKLYKKYDFTDEEILYIESLIRPMELDNE